MQDIVLRETRNGELMLSAVVDGVEKRALVTRKSADYLGILQIGGIHLSESELISYAIAYLL